MKNCENYIFAARRKNEGLYTLEGMSKKGMVLLGITTLKKETLGNDNSIE